MTEEEFIEEMKDRGYTEKSAEYIELWKEIEKITSLEERLMMLPDRVYFPPTEYKASGK